GSWCSTAAPAGPPHASSPGDRTDPTAPPSEPREKRYCDAAWHWSLLVSGSSTKRPEPSGINAMRLVYQISTGHPWVKPGDDIGRVSRGNVRDPSPRGSDGTCPGSVSRSPCAACP